MVFGEKAKRPDFGSQTLRRESVQLISSVEADLLQNRYHDSPQCTIDKTERAIEAPAPNGGNLL
jgi:hypothetical protein